MDPEEALRRLREIAQRTVDEENLDLDDCREMMETFLGLDGWLRGGGFLPKDWERKDLPKE